MAKKRRQTNEKSRHKDAVTQSHVNNNVQSFVFQSKQVLAKLSTWDMGKAFKIQDFLDKMLVLIGTMKKY
jgi:hypothetical protein